jgi:hypothetical protein
MRDWRSVSRPHSQLLDRQADPELWRGCSLADWSPRGPVDVYRQHDGRGGAFGAADVEIDRDAKHRQARSRGHRTRDRQPTRLHGGVDPVPAFGPRLDDETARDKTAFRIGRKSGALTVSAKCGSETRIAPVWVVSSHHGSSVLLGYQPRSGRDAGGPVIASLVPSGADARNRTALSWGPRSTALVRGGVHASVANSGGSPRSAIVSIAQSQEGVSSPAGSECNPYSEYWGDGSGCANGWHDNAWCADFAAWAWRQAGVSFTYGYAGSDINAWAASFYAWGLATGNWHSLSSGYQPQPGDVAVYGRLLEQSGGGSHVGIYVSGPAGDPTVVNGDWEYPNPNVAQVYEQSNEQNTGPGGGSLDGYVSVPNGTETGGGTTGSGGGTAPPPGTSPTGPTTTPSGAPAAAGKPSAIVNSNYSNIDVFYRDTSGDLEDDSWSATSGQGYQTRTIATGVAGNPVAVVNSSYAQIDVFYRGTNGDLMDASWSSTPAGYTVRQIASGIAGDPAAIVNSAYDQIDVYYRDVNGNLQDASWSATPAGYTVRQIASGIEGDPAAVVDDSYSNIDVFYRDTNGDLEDDSWSANSGEGYQTRTVAGGITGDPAAVANGSYTNIDVFYPGAGGQLQDTYWSASSGQGYQTRTVAGGVAGDPSAIVNDSYSQIDVFYPGSDGDLWDASWSATSGHGYQTQEITPGIAGDPSAIVNGSYSNIDVFYPGSNGDLWDATWSATPAGYTTYPLPTS